MALPRRGYPLGALFLLVAACGVLTALVTPVGRAVANDKVTLVELLVSIGVGIIVVAALGAIVGTFHYRVWRGIGLGALTGGYIGLMAGPLVLVPAEAFTEVLAASVGGSIVLLIVGAFLRLASGKEG